MPSRPHVFRLALPVLGLAALAGCAAPAGGADGGEVSVVASTSVYGAIAREIAGDSADVRSIVTLGNQDPHGYEATARDQLTLARADLVIQNGGGYDSFVTELLETTGTDPLLVTAVESDDDVTHDDATHDEEPAEAGHDHAHGGNEHVWYSLHAMEELAANIRDALIELDPAHRPDYESNAAKFTDGLAMLDQRVHALSQRASGATALATEPVPLLLFEDAGIEDVTPVEFLAAIEDERDVPPAVLAEALDLIAGGDVQLVAFNEQTVDATSTRLVDAAEANGVPVVHFSELPPAGTGYLDWMGANIDRIEAALG